MTITARIAFTFQSGDIQIDVTEENKKLKEQSLHSNLVIFKSNGSNGELIEVNFTFQSGDIQICQYFKHYIFLFNFTFQSGDIQISGATDSVYPDKDTLHSNLVIFKSCYIVLYLCHFRHFTFQSGDIQIIYCFVFSHNNEILYIPIW